MNGPAVDELIAKAVSPHELVDYQRGAVLSRVLIQSPNGSVTLHAFDDDQELDDRIMPFDALIYLLEGKAEVTIATKPFPLVGGQIMLLPAHQKHSVKAHGRCELLMVMIRAE